MSMPGHLLPRRITLATLALAWLGCATSVKSLPSGYAGGRSSEGVVIGRLLTGLREPPRIPVLEYVQQFPTARLYVEHSGGQDYEIVCDEPTASPYFFVALPPGSYRLTGIKHGNLEASLSGSFEVAADRVNYVGELAFVKKEDVKALVMGALAGGIPGAWSVGDMYEDAVPVFQKRYPQLHQEVVRSLIKLQ